MLIAPTAVVALLLLAGLYRAVRGWRRRLAAERTAQRLLLAQLQRDVDALTAVALYRAAAVRVLDDARRVVDQALAMYGHTPTHPDWKGDGDEHP